ncbi:ATP-dependent Clp protease proteolytic subunit-like [Zingiber officinale]|uniref:ATP-dependent Clp protease proteolytic subunit-like n=1 Tax=Zingiber officinale TaxID=94328 RepID=UPI001C4D3D49|nr:ATP-dependent Clp protease proteolytic subunit-like [Zingiber officinale]
MSCAWRQLALYRYLHPSVERAAAGPRSFSDEIFSRLFNQRIVCINGPISDDTASVVIGQLLFLQSESSHDPIRLRINSPGGTITAGLAIYDTVRYISTPISTLCIGQATSIASLLLAAGTPGKRYALPHSRIMIHQPTGEPFDKATGIAMHAKEILKLRECVNKIYSYHTGQTIRQMEQCMDRDMFMFPDEAKEFGLIDRVIVPLLMLEQRELLTGVLLEPNEVPTEPNPLAEILPTEIMLSSINGTTNQTTTHLTT